MPSIRSFGAGSCSREPEPTSLFGPPTGHDLAFVLLGDRRAERDQRDPVGARLDEARLVALLRRPVGLVGGGRLLDLLFEGRSDFVLDLVRGASAA